MTPLLQAGPSARTSMFPFWERLQFGDIVGIASQMRHALRVEICTGSLATTLVWDAVLCRADDVLRHIAEG